MEKCTSCKSTINDCRICNTETSVLSATEIEEYNIMKDHCIFNEHDRKLHVRYPFSSDPSILVDNSGAAFKRQVAAEKKQLKNGVHAQYVVQFQDMIRRGVVSKVTPEEIEAYQGPINYIVHSEVYKDSNSTPVRLVSDSSFKNGNISLNDCLVKGPNTLNDINNNFVKFRSYQVGLMYDLTKAYNSMQTDEVERHCRRFFMRTSTEDKWDLWAFNVVQFGDKPAAALLAVAVEKASES